MSERHFPRPLTPRSAGAIAACLLATALLVALDLGSKQWALDHLSAARIGPAAPACTQPGVYQRSMREPLIIVPGFFELRYAENCGAAFGFLNDVTSKAKHGLFYGAAIGASLLLGWMFVTGRGGRAFAWSVPFVVAGAIGNFADRIRYGYVVDFIRFYYREYSYPTFNVADIAITVGVALLLVDGLREGKLDREALARQEAADRAKSEPKPEAASPGSEPPTGDATGEEGA